MCIFEPKFYFPSKIKKKTEYIFPRLDSVAKLDSPSDLRLRKRKLSQGKENRPEVNDDMITMV